MGFETNCGSVEQIQVDIFERDLCGGAKTSIYQYSMVLFWNSNLQGLCLCTLPFKLPSSSYMFDELKR